MKVYTRGDIMIIGVLENSKDDSMVKYLSDKLLAKIIDADQLLENICRERFGISEISSLNPTLLLRIRNFIDETIQGIVETSTDGINLIIRCSFLEDLFVYNNCNILIDALTNDNNKNLSDINLLMKNKCNNVCDYSGNYHLKIDKNDDWKKQIDDYIDYNIDNKVMVTVVVPIYNTSEYLIRCVKSITNQTYRNLEIVLIDDGSTDNSLEICNLLAKSDKRIKVIHQKNQGLANTRNNGMDLANGEYICFIDSDDYIEYSMIETLLKKIQETNSDVCECSFFIHQKDGTIKDVTVEQKGNKYISGKKNLIDAYADATILIPAWDKLYRLDSIKNIKFSPNCFKEDADYIYRLCMEEKSCSLVAYPFYHYIKRKNTSLTGSKISSKLFTLKKWGENTYNEVMSFGLEYQDIAEKILYNSYVHILRNYIRDYKNKLLENNEFQDEIQEIVNNIISLLLQANNVCKFRKLEEVLIIINTLVEGNVIDSQKFPSIDIPCIGILWNSLNDDMKREALELLQERSIITEYVAIDFEDNYRDFIKEIYYYNNEFEGIPIMKAGTLIDRYENNEILLIKMVINVSNYVYYNKLKGFMFKEIAELKSYIRKQFKSRITDYAYDNVFHMTVDLDEYLYTDLICKKYIKKIEDDKQNARQGKKLSKRHNNKRNV